VLAAQVVDELPAAAVLRECTKFEWRQAAVMAAGHLDGEIPSWFLRCCTSAFSNMMVTSYDAGRHGHCSVWLAFSSRSSHAGGLPDAGNFEGSKCCCRYSCGRAQRSQHPEGFGAERPHPVAGVDRRKGASRRCAGGAMQAVDGRHVGRHAKLRCTRSRHHACDQMQAIAASHCPDVSRQQPGTAERTRRKYASSVLDMLRLSSSAPAASGADTKSSQPHTRLAICAKPANDTASCF